MPKEYIWRCPRDRCNAIVLKTTKPFIMDGTFKCKHCNCFVSADELIRANMEILLRFIAEIEVGKTVDNCTIDKIKRILLE